VLVSAPTGSGKTVVAEHAVALALGAGRRCFYTAPIKALSNQKFHDLIDELGEERVGLLTGDHSIRPDAPVVVMTTEVLRNMVYARSAALADLDWVVLDEVHFLADAYRGPVWEEVLIHTPPAVRFVCLSATVSNATELGEWIETLRGPTETVLEHRRPIELDPLLFVGDRTSEREHLVPLLVGGRPNPEGHRFDADRPSRPPGPGRRPRSRFFTPRRVETIERLASEDLLPAIYFIFSRNGCDEAARQCFDAGLRLTEPEERLRIRELAEQRTAALGDDDLDVLGYDRWLEALEQGIAAHHAGMIPAFREAVEACFVEGLVKVVFATETLALGINMPARTVLIERLSKFNGEGHEFLTPAQFTQLTGRAGRRGIDDEGYAVVLWSPFATFSQVAGLAASREFPLASSFRPTYNMAANLVERYSRDDALEVLTRSFAQFQADRAVVRMTARADRLRAELDELRATAQRPDLAVFDAAGYAQLTDEVRATRRQRAGGRAQVQEALGRLRPGDVLQRRTPKGTRLAVVVSVSSRKGGAVRVRVVNASGNQSSLDASSPPGDLVPVAHVELPVPYQPQQPEFRREAARRLRRVNPKRLPRTAAGGRRTSDPHEEAVRALQSHPLHHHPDREELLRSHLGVAAREKDLADLEREMARRGSGLVDRFESVLSVLEATGHAAGWSLTAAGERLRRIYHEGDLLLSLAIDGGVLDGLDAAEVAAVVSCLTYEHRSSEPAPEPVLPSQAVRRAVSALHQVWSGLEQVERRHRLPTTREPQAGFAAAAWAWASGQDLDHILDEDLTGGDFVRNVRQLVDVLRQLDEVAADAATSRAARQAGEALTRGVVLASGGPA
jgi:ATP-dependent RNA helicase HelY